MSDLDRQRAARLMALAEIDALVLFQPEAFRYAIGLDTGVAGMWLKSRARALMLGVCALECLSICVGGLPSLLAALLVLLLLRRAGTERAAAGA